MNERIKELAEQARDWGYAEHSGYTAQLLFEEKFAESIIRECIATVQKRYMGDNNREDMEVLRCVADMKKHFGVEE